MAAAGPFLAPALRFGIALPAPHRPGSRRRRRQPDAVGQLAVVTARIPADARGRVRLASGGEWAARTSDGRGIDAGAKVRVVCRRRAVLTVTERI